MDTFNLKNYLYSKKIGIQNGEATKGCLEVLEANGIAVQRQPRKLSFAAEGQTQIQILRALDGLELLKARYLQSMLLGSESWQELSPQFSKLQALQRYQISNPWKLVLANSSGEFNPSSFLGNIIATKYVQAAFGFLSNLGLRAFSLGLEELRFSGITKPNAVGVLQTTGSTEGFIRFGAQNNLPVTAIIDVVSSGESLKANDLQIAQIIEEGGIVLVSNV